VAVLDQWLLILVPGPFVLAALSAFRHAMIEGGPSP
jgi:hypothetical protein